MTKRKIQELVSAILSGIPRLSLAQARQKGLARGKLIRVDHAHRVVERHFASLFDELERACCTAKTRAQLKRRFNAIFRRHAQSFKISLRLAPLPNESLVQKATGQHVEE